MLVDPVMGDHGKPYRTYTPELCGRMRDLAAQADVITPNLTEAALLLEEDYADLPRDEEGLRAWLERLSLDGRRSVVLTGVSLRPGAIGAGCFDRATGRIRFAMARQEPASSPEPAIFSPAWCWGRCSGGSRWRQRPSGRRSLSSGAQPTPWRWAPRFWRGSSSSRCWES